MELSYQASEWLHQQQEPSQSSVREATKQAIAEGTQLSLLSAEATANQSETTSPQAAESDLSSEPEPAIADGASEAIAENQAIAQILPPGQQGSQAAKNVAKLLQDAGISSEVLQGEDYHLRAEQDHYLPLVVERHDDHLYLTHYNSMNGDKFIDAEMIFKIGDRGNLSLAETASFNPFTGGELRNKDHSFAKLFSTNLLDQRWAIALSEARENLKQSAQAEQQSSDSVDEEQTTQSRDIPKTPENWATVAQALGRQPDYVAKIGAILHQPLSEKADSAMKRDFAEHRDMLNMLRSWYRAAHLAEKPQAYLTGIQAIAKDFKDGKPLTPGIESAMNQDLYEGIYAELEKGLDVTQGEECLKQVAQRGFERNMPLETVSAILLYGHKGLRETHKIQPRETEKHIGQIIKGAIQELPLAQKQSILKAHEQNQQQNRGISL